MQSSSQPSSSFNESSGEPADQQHAPNSDHPHEGVANTTWILLEEARFLQEVESYIGNPDDWSEPDSEDSNSGDSLGIGLSEQGLIDEEGLDEELIELFDESWDCDTESEEIQISNFIYDNNSGMVLPFFIQSISED